MNRKSLFVCLGLSVFLTACDDSKKADAQAPDAVVKTHAYQCDDVNVEVTFTGADARDDAATVVVDGVVLPMKGVPAANGAKYADEQGNSFWAVGDSAGTLLLKDQKSRDCTLLVP